MNGKHKVTRVGPEDGSAVLLIHPWWGVTPAVHEWANTLAGVGRRVIVPDLFDGQKATTIEEAEALQEKLSERDTLERLDRLADKLSGQGRPWAVMGFSLGAFYACHLAGRGHLGPDELILFYGGQPPGGEVKRTCQVDLHVVPDDEFFTDDEWAETDEGFRAAGVEPRTFVYEDSNHWFAERSSPGFDAYAFSVARSRVTARICD